MSAVPFSSLNTSCAGPPLLPVSSVARGVVAMSTCFLSPAIEALCYLQYIAIARVTLALHLVDDPALCILQPGHCHTSKSQRRAMYCYMKPNPTYTLTHNQICGCMPPIPRPRWYRCISTHAKHPKSLKVDGQRPVPCFA